MKKNRFQPIEPMTPKSWLNVLKWQLTSQRAVWPQWVDHGPTARPPMRVEGSVLHVSFVNHSTVLLQTRGMNILVDPVWSDRVSPFSFWGPKRVHAPGIAWADLPPIDLVLISHSHYDHLDMQTVKKMVLRDDPLFIVPLGVDTIIRNAVKQARMQAMNWEQAHQVSADLTIHAEPVQHWSARGLWDRNHTLWTSFVLEFQDGKIYYTGDTGYFSGNLFRNIFAKHGPMRFALIPIGAYEPRWFMKESHINPEEAVKIFHDLQAQAALGIHFGTFQLTDEAIDAPVQALDEALKAAQIPPEKFRALKPGERWIVD